MEQKIGQEIVNTLTKIEFLKHENILESLETPPQEQFGDLASNICFSLAKELKKSPMQISQEVVSKLRIPKDSLIHKVEVKGGYINFFYNYEKVSELLLKEILKQNKKYGSSNISKGKKVIVEYSSPNIAKPFTIGHLRSTIIGDATANVLEFIGWKVYRDNHLGDWGTQFGKQIYAIMTWGNEKEIENSKSPVKELVDLYVKFHSEAEKNPSLEDEGRKWFKKLENGDPIARKLWKKCIDWSMKEFRNIYKRLNVKFTENNGLGYGESFFEDKMSNVIKELENKKLLKESKGAKLIFFSGDKLPPLMILKSDGATLYATRDLATDKFRLKKYGKDIMVINETGSEQSLYWKQIFTSEEMLGWYTKEQRYHLKHGLFRFKDSKMSTRKGNVVWLEDVLNNAVNKAREIIEKSATAKELFDKEKNSIAEIVGIGAIKYFDLSHDPISDVIFDWESALSFEGDTGPYLQYAYVRANKILEKAGKWNEKFSINKLKQEEKLLIKKLLEFPEIVQKAAKDYKPHYICNYTHDLADLFSSFYHACPVLQAENSDLKNFRLTLVKAFKITLKNALSLLGMGTPKVM